MVLALMFQSGWSNFIAMVSVPPHSLWFIILVSFIVSMVSTLLNRVVLDTNQMSRQQDIITEHGKWKKELQKMAEENPKKYAKEYVKFQRKDASIQKMQQKMSLSRMKPMCITFVPMIVMFYLLRTLYTQHGNPSPVACPPMNPWDIYYVGNMMHASFQSTIRDIPVSEGWINFTTYYFLCSLGLNTVIQKVFGIQKATGGFGGGGMSSAFEGQTQLPKPTV